MEIYSINLTQLPEPTGFKYVFAQDTTNREKVEKVAKDNTFILGQTSILRLMWYNGLSLDRNAIRALPYGKHSSVLRDYSRAIDCYFMRVESQLNTAKADHMTRLG